MEGTEKQGTLAPSVDLFGFNYFSGIWDSFHQAYPKLPLICTGGQHIFRNPRLPENRSRKLPPVRNGQAAGQLPGRRTGLERRRPAGVSCRDLPVGLGSDYHGEPAPYGWPAVASQFGIMDLCGFPKDTYYYYKAWWGSEDVSASVPGRSAPFGALPTATL